MMCAGWHPSVYVKALYKRKFGGDVSLLLRSANVSALVVMAIAVATVGVETVLAAPRCGSKTAVGTGPNEEVAKFQVYEGLLRSVDSGLWGAWLATGTTPSYRVGKPVYTCRRGLGLGVSCSGRTTVCKT
jgi:hypothetical protein